MNPKIVQFPDKNIIEARMRDRLVDMVVNFSIFLTENDIVLNADKVKEEMLEVEKIANNLLIREFNEAIEFQWRANSEKYKAIMNVLIKNKQVMRIPEKLYGQK